MKDGFDKSVAEKMPKIQKKRPNRPWNVDPVLIRAQEESRARVAETRQTRKKEKEPGAVQARQARSEGQEPKALPASQAREEAKESETLQAVQKEAAAAAGAADPIVLDPGAPEADPAGNAVSMDKELDALSLNDIRSSGNGDLTKAVETIKDLNSDFTRIVFERKAIQQKLDRSA
ncbi:MAG: hypothetical protein RBT82_14130, partial [Desulfomonilia bacterium]|nr:hypothetical protein [Desulfomonilia bacterium]